MDNSNSNSNSNSNNSNLSPTDRINLLNIRICRGESVSDEELRQAIIDLRNTRGQAVEGQTFAKAKSATKAKSTPIDLAALFANIGGKG